MGSLKTDTIDILVHWGITPVTKTDIDGNSYIIYEYEEERLNRPLPAGVRSLEDITAYFTARYDRLLVLAGSETVPNRISDIEQYIVETSLGA
jgi:hypothetical protein